MAAAGKLCDIYLGLCLVRTSIRYGNCAILACIAEDLNPGYTRVANTRAGIRRPRLGNVFVCAGIYSHSRSRNRGGGRRKNYLGRVQELEKEYPILVQ